MLHPVPQEPSENGDTDQETFLKDGQAFESRSGWRVKLSTVFTTGCDKVTGFRHGGMWGCDRNRILDLGLRLLRQATLNEFRHIAFELCAAVADDVHHVSCFVVT